MRSELQTFSSELSVITERAQRSVVRIRNGVKAGAGVVIGRGLIVTCRHVAESGPVKVDLGMRSAPGLVVASDRNNDLALVSCAVERPAARLTDDVRAGEVVVAIGAPGGRTGFASAGIIARVGGAVQGPHGAWLDVIEMDVLCSPGNSGGAVVNSRGDVVGIVVGILSSGCAFAVRSRRVKALMTGL